MAGKEQHWEDGSQEKLQEASQQRDSMIAKAQEEARTEAVKILDEAKVRIQEEKEAALRDVRREVATLSLAIAEKVIRKELSDDKVTKLYLRLSISAYKSSSIE